DQLGLLHVDYSMLDEFCSDETFASTANSDLRKLAPANREQLCRLLFDEMRRSLCIESRYLDHIEQDKAKTSAYSLLNERWDFQPDERLETSSYRRTKSKKELSGQRNLGFVSAAPRARIVRRSKRGCCWEGTAVAGKVQDWKG